MSASMNLLLKEVKDVIECPICTEIFSSPKMLPCFHTFCLKCIEQYGKDTPGGDNLTCPLCREEFKVPIGGLSKLKSNFFIELLVETTESVATKNQAALCDVCLVGKKHGESAFRFCIECQQSMCHRCSHIHGSMTTTKNHHLSALEDVLSTEIMKHKFRQKFCDKHTTKELKLYCRECRRSFCSIGKHGKHSKHDVCEIDEIVRMLKDDLLKFSKDVNERMLIITEQISSYKKFMENLTKTKTIIIQRSEDIKRKVDDHTNDLLFKLISQEMSISRDIQDANQQMQKNRMVCDKIKQVCLQVDCGALCYADVPTIAGELCARAEELSDLPIQELRDLPEIKFVPSSLKITDIQDNIVGELSGESKKFKVSVQFA